MQGAGEFVERRFQEMQEPCHAILELAKHPGFGANLPPKLMVYGETQKLEPVHTDGWGKIPLKLCAGVMLASAATEAYAKVLRSAAEWAAHAAKTRDLRAALLAARGGGVRMPGQRKKKKLHWPS